MPRPSLRTCFIAVAVAIVGLHLVAVSLAALPPNRYSDAARPQLTYLNPYFTQNWRLFAPNPIAEDRSLLFQGSYVDPAGEPAVTRWVDWTAVELDLVRHRLVGGRAGYVTNKLVSPLGARADRLGGQQQLTAVSTSQTEPPSWAALADQLDVPGSDPAAISGFLRYDRSAVRLGTDVLVGRHPDLALTGVRYMVRTQGVVPYASRDASSAGRARPAAIDEVGGWRRPTPGTAAERASVRDFDRAHR